MLVLGICPIWPSHCAAGEFLCPICRRLGNCLLPLAGCGAVLPNEQPATVQHALAVPEAVEQLKQLLSSPDSWVAAPVTADAACVRTWQLDGTSAAGAPAGQHQPANAMPPAASALFCSVGRQAECVAALCTFACQAACAWIRQQRRMMEWVQAQGVSFCLVLEVLCDVHSG